MAMTYWAGSKVPTSAEITTLLAQTIGNSTPNELQIIAGALSAKNWTRTGPAAEATITTILP